MKLADKVNHLINSEGKFKSEQDLINQNNILRKYIVDVKEELKRVLNKINSKDSGASTKRGTPAQRLAFLTEEIKFNEEIIAAQTEEIMKYEKALIKASNVEYMVELEEKINQVKSETKKADREKRNLEYLYKKDLYTGTGYYLADPDLDHEKKKASVLGDKREMIDRLRRQIAIQTKSNKEAAELIVEQKQHLGELNERFKKLTAIANHRGIILNPKKGKEKDKEELKRKRDELLRAIDILEKSIAQKMKQHENELDQIKKDIQMERKVRKINYKSLEKMNKTTELLKLEIQEYQNLNYHNLWDQNLGEVLLNLDENNSRNSHGRIQVTPNDITSTNIITEEDGEGSIINTKRKGRRKASGTDSQGNSKEDSDFDGDEENRLTTDGQENDSPDVTDKKSLNIFKTGIDDLLLSHKTPEKEAPFINVNQSEKVFTDKKPEFSQSELFKKKKTLDENDLADERKNMKAYEAYSLLDGQVFSSRKGAYELEIRPRQLNRELSAKNTQLSSPINMFKPPADPKPSNDRLTLNDITDDHTRTGSKPSNDLITLNEITDNTHKDSSVDKIQPETKEDQANQKIVGSMNLSMGGLNLPFDRHSSSSQNNYSLSGQIFPDSRLIPEGPELGSSKTHSNLTSNKVSQIHTPANPNSKSAVFNPLSSNPESVRTSEAMHINEVSDKNIPSVNLNESLQQLKRGSDVELPDRIEPARSSTRLRRHLLAKKESSEINDKSRDFIMRTEPSQSNATDPFAKFDNIDALELSAKGKKFFEGGNDTTPVNPQNSLQLEKRQPNFITDRPTVAAVTKYQGKENDLETIGIDNDKDKNKSLLHNDSDFQPFEFQPKDSNKGFRGVRRLKMSTNKSLRDDDTMEKVRF